MAFRSLQRRSGRNLSLALGSIIAFWLASALMIPQRAASQGGDVPVATRSAASYAPIVAPNSIAAAFGVGLATQVAYATTQPLPTSLAGATVRVNGELAGLFFVSPLQINYLIPAGAPPGLASVVVTSGDGRVSTGSAQIAAVAPALFTASGDGQGALASQLLRVKANGQLIYEPLAQGIVTRPIDFGEESDQLFLVLYLTGVRQAPASGVRVSMGGVEYAPLFVGAVGGLSGLDQINVALPRNFSGRGRITLLVKANGYGASNGAEFEIGSGAQSQGTMQISAPAQPVLAGEELEVSGAGFAANPRENNAQIVADDGLTAKAEVLAVGASTIRIRVPFGAGTGQLKVSRGQIEASATIQVRTSVSGFIERAVSQDGRIVRTPVPGARVRLRERPEIERVTDAEGSFVMPDLTPGNKVEFEILPPANGSLNFPTKKFPMPVRAGRDNQIPRGDEQTVISGVSFPLLVDSDPSNTESNANVAAPSPDQNLTLTYLEPGRTPANLPAGHFSARIAQIAPFGQTISPGARLSFPNADAIPVGTTAKLFKFDQTNGSATLGQFIDIGSATVTTDGQRVETAPNAITEGSFYFVSIERPRAVISGRVVESDGRPAPRAIVQTRGQSTFTDGFGGFVLNNVPVMKASGDRVRVEVSYQRPSGRVSRKESSEVELTAGALVTIRPDIALDPETTTFPPVILAPATLTLEAGETLEFDIVVIDPDSSQTPEVTMTGAATAFTTLINQRQGAYRLRISPGSNAAGDYALNLTVAQTTKGITVTVNQRGDSQPVARSQAVTLDEDTTRGITLNGRDPGGRQLSYMVVSGPSRGSLSGTAPNLIYRPAPNFNGVDSFTFKVNNGSAESQEATVYISVKPVNDAPLLNAPGSQAVNAGETLNLVVTATDVDGDQALQFTATDLPPGATFTEIGGTSRLLSWTPSITQEGAYTVNITVTDNGAPSLSDTRAVRLMGVARWAKTSGPEGGRINSLLNAGGALFAGTNGGGVYRSSDDGQSWTAVNNGLSGQGLNVYALLSVGATLYAGTDGGVYRSSDGAQSWTAGRVFICCVHTLLSVGTNLYAGTYGGGVIRSSDGGQNWTVVNNGLSGYGLYVVAFHSVGTNLYAGTYGGGVYRSSDGGESWTVVNNGLPNGGLYVNALLSVGVDLYAGTLGGVYRSSNGGQSWTSVSGGLSGNEMRVNALRSVGTNLYAGTDGGVYRSSNGGQSWTAVSNGLSGGSRFVYALSQVETNLYAGTGNGVYRSSDGGQSWRLSSAGFIAAGIRSILARNNELFAGTEGGGVYSSSDGGQSWTAVSNGLDSRFLSIYALSSVGINLYAGTNGGGVYRSSNDGQSWTAVNNGLSDYGLYVHAFLSVGATLYAGTDNGVYRSSDGGQSWAAASNGLSDNGLAILTMISVGTNLYAGTLRGVYRSSDGGQSWTAVNNGLPGDISQIYIYWLTSVGTNIYASPYAHGVYRSSDGGQSWTAVNNGLPGGAIFVDALYAAGTTIYAGISGRYIYRMSDSGQSWAQVSPGFIKRFYSLTASNGKIYGGTGGDSVWVLTDDAQSWTEINAGLTSKFTNAFAISGTDFFAGTLGAGVFRSSDQGQNWIASNTGLPPNPNIQSIVTNGATLWAASFGDGVYASADRGASWSAVNSGLTNKLVNKLFLSGATLYAGTDGGVFRSTNGGASWTAINTGLNSQRAVSFTLANGLLYAGTDGGGVFRLNPNGTSWTQVNRGLTSQLVTALGASGSVLYAGTTGGGVCVSRDGGENWTPVNNSLPANLNVYGFAVSGRKVYAGSVYGVFVTEDEGQSWKQVNAGLLNTFVTGLAVSGDQLFASTASGGMFSSKIP
ncbi:MAG TPA: Ig-like domain-containing protein [Blastocatellia bacterium]|nr:Ig-like domain-containing protein [Blastocatellia bacterium]